MRLLFCFVFLYHRCLCRGRDGLLLSLYYESTGGILDRVSEDIYGILIYIILSYNVNICGVFFFSQLLGVTVWFGNWNLEIGQVNFSRLCELSPQKRISACRRTSIDSRCRRNSKYERSASRGYIYVRDTSTSQSIYLHDRESIYLVQTLINNGKIIHNSLIKELRVLINVYTCRILCLKKLKLIIL